MRFLSALALGVALTMGAAAATPPKDKPLQGPTQIQVKKRPPVWKKPASSKQPSKVVALPVIKGANTSVLAKTKKSTSNDPKPPAIVQKIKDNTQYKLKEW